MGNVLKNSETLFTSTSPVIFCAGRQSEIITAANNNIFLIAYKL